MPTTRIQIIISQTGAQSVKKDIDSVGASAKKSGDSLGLLKGVLAGFLTLQGAQALMKLADAGTQLENSLKVLGKTGDDFTNSQNKLYDIALRNGQSVNELANVYQRLSTVQGQLGISGDKVNKVLEGVAASMRMSSANSSAQAGALQQLSQLLGGVNVQAQEYNSLIDGAYPLLQAVANGSERWGGSVAKLTQDVKASGVTVKDFTNALIKGSDSAIALADTFQITIGQSIQNFTTALIRMVQQLNNTTGVFNSVANGINFLANNMSILVTGLTALGSVIAIVAARYLIGQFVAALSSAASAVGLLISGVGRLLLLILTNPFTAFVIGLAVVIGYFTDWQKVIETVISAVGRLTTALGNLTGSTALKDFGLKLQVDAKQAAADLANAGTNVAKKIQEASGTGSAQYSKEIIKGSAEGAQVFGKMTSDIAEQIYANLNGRIIKPLGDTMIDGGNYIYNQVTGSITKSSPQLASDISNGGDYAGSTMYDSITSAGIVAGQSMSKAVMEAAARAKASADYNDKIAQQQRDYYRNFDNGGALSLPGGSSINIGDFLRDNPTQIISYGNDQFDNNYRDNYVNRKTYTSSTGGSSNSSSSSDSGGGGGGSPVNNNKIDISNYLDPNMMLDALNTKKGTDTLKNVIKANPQEFQSILGIN